jgi:hypothetical protein
MDPTYFELAGKVLQDDEPWKRYIDFAQQVMTAAREHLLVNAAPMGELVRAHKYFEAAGRNLRHAGYLHCRRTCGARMAEKVFAERPNAVEELTYILRH